MTTRVWSTLCCLKVKNGKYKIFMNGHNYLTIANRRHLMSYSMLSHLHRLSTELNELHMGQKFTPLAWKFLLFISYKFDKGFLAITFLLHVNSSWNFHDVCQRFLYIKEQNCSWIRQKMRNSLIDPHYKNRPLL